MHDDSVNHSSGGIVGGGDRNRTEREHDDVAPDKIGIEALRDIICGAGEDAAAALPVLMATLENSIEPKALANTAKHLAFTRCGEVNLYGMVDPRLRWLRANSSQVRD